MKTSTKFWIAVGVSAYFWLWYIGLSLYTNNDGEGLKTLGELILTLLIIATGFMVTFSLFVLSEYAGQLVKKFNNWLNKHD